MLLSGSPLLLALQSDAGTLEVVSRAFKKATGLDAGSHASFGLSGTTGEAWSLLPESLPLRRALDLVTQMARGLMAAAEKGVIHRDVKPDNVMLTLKGQVKLTDFGLVKNLHGDVRVTSPGIVLGTPLYMSPEQARGEELDLRSDIYSLGATFFQLLCGQPPFRGESAIAVIRKHEEADLPPATTLPGTVSARVYEIIRRMMAKRPGNRFDSYEALLEALDAC